MLDHSESRAFIRMDVSCEMTYKFPDSDQSFVGTCLNLSGSGVLFTTDQALKAGAALEVTISPENSLTPPMKAYVEVIRCKDVEPGVYEVATEIKGIRAV
ncbi:PilZ domain-containing protein [methanotrophic endosymbiont of Bathymodiolus puteoserpentis (Logatchev)]|jgi:hypothetical protein|uniref:PilZ domain-containing protein n=1 Tax=methanotrophic endosymbiont of Bathymodiolus puteoserpentis (Logatchev) TaxID=343235 RepID=UPI00157A24DD|nr:PilZ domain-containing protein [methanotrophic endosymbiont of Bathymodiolus puteoserpentis (Logatchev)]